MLSVIIAILAACTADTPPNSSSPSVPDTSDSGPTEPSTPLETTDSAEEPVYSVDMASVSGIELTPGGDHTRAVVAADFDNDGDDDLFIGNPGDMSYVLRNVSSPGAPRFEHIQTLSDGHLSWTAAAADYDNDGDVDLFVGGGGNECHDIDQLWENQLMESGTVSFVEVRLQMGLTLNNEFLDKIATTGARWADFDNDGRLDLYTTHNSSPGCNKGGNRDEAKNQLWRNEGDRFVNVTKEVGARYGGNTRHPAVFDYDRDGDLDIFNSNYQYENVLLQNLLMETGELMFADATAGLAQRGDSIATSINSFAACAADLNNDGFEDLVVLNRTTSVECGVSTTTSTAPSGNIAFAHSVYRNIDGTRFEDLTGRTGLDIIVEDLNGGVMGNQIGDVNGDGAIDVFVGNGGPKTGSLNDLFLGSRDQFAFTAASASVQLPSEAGKGERAFRTHGTIIADLDGDGAPDMLVGNGGPAAYPELREPNQLFLFDWGNEPTFVTVRLRGDGVTVNRDAVGARAELVLIEDDGTQRSLFRSVSAGSCFSADNGRALPFGLDGATPLELRVTWPDGTESLHPVSTTDARMTIDYPR